MSFPCATNVGSSLSNRGPVRVSEQARNAVATKIPKRRRLATPQKELRLGAWLSGEGAVGRSDSICMTIPGCSSPERSACVGKWAGLASNKLTYCGFSSRLRATDQSAARLRPDVVQEYRLAALRHQLGDFRVSVFCCLTVDSWLGSATDVSPRTSASCCTETFLTPGAMSVPNLAT